MLRIDLEAASAGIKTANHMMQGSVDVSADVLGLSISIEVLVKFRRLTGMSNEEMVAAFNALTQMNMQAAAKAMRAGEDENIIAEYERMADKYRNVAELYSDKLQATEATLEAVKGV